MVNFAKKYSESKCQTQPRQYLHKTHSSTSARPITLPGTHKNTNTNAIQNSVYLAYFFAATMCSLNQVPTHLPTETFVNCHFLHATVSKQWRLTSYHSNATKRWQHTTAATALMYSI